MDTFRQNLIVSQAQKKGRSRGADPEVIRRGCLKGPFLVHRSIKIIK